MADRPFGSLPVAADVADADLFLLRKGATDHQVDATKVREPLLRKSANLSDVASPSTARTNLDVPQTGDVLLKAGNLSGLASASTSRTNLGLGTAAVATLGTSTGQVPTADQIPGLAVHDAVGFDATTTFVVPAGVLRIHYMVAGASGGGGGGGGTGGSNDGTAGGAGGRSYIEDDDTSTEIAGLDDVTFDAGGGEGGYDDDRGGQGGASRSGFGQSGFEGRTGVSGAPGGYGGRSAIVAIDATGNVLADGFQTVGGAGGAGASGAGGGGGGAPGALCLGSIDTSGRIGDTWNIIVGTGGGGGTGGTGGGSNGAAGSDGFIVLWW